MRKKKLFIVGYDNDHQCVYGKSKIDPITRVITFEFCDPMTAFDVKKAHKNMPSKGAVIYKLVKVDPKNLEVKK